MTSRIVGQFDDELIDLLRQHAHGLRRHVQRFRGQQPKLTGKKVRTAIRVLQGLAERVIFQSKEARRALKDYDDRRRWHTKGKGRGWHAKRKSFKAWFRDQVGAKHCVYAFWRKRVCVYIGRTHGGGNRPSHHFEKLWFANVTRIDVYSFAGKRDLARFECMLTHHHDPIQLRATPSRKKYSSRCLVCDANRKIRSEIKRIFRLR